MEKKSIEYRIRRFECYDAVNHEVKFHYGVEWDEPETRRKYWLFGPIMHSTKRKYASQVRSCQYGQFSTAIEFSNREQAETWIVFAKEFGSYSYMNSTIVE